MSGGLQVGRLTCRKIDVSGGLLYRKLTGLTGQKLSCQEIDGQEVNRLTPKGMNKSGSLQVWRFTGQKVVRWGY
jgi:hypothetical protein